MLNVPVNEFKKKIGFYLNRIKKGESFILKEDEKPIAEISPLTNHEKRPIGLAKGDFVVPNDFDSPRKSDKKSLKFGSGKGSIEYIADDFNATPEDFKDYI